MRPTQIQTIGLTIVLAGLDWSITSLFLRAWNMSEVGAFEAKTHLPKLLERVQRGERFVITKHGRPVAELVPFRERDPDKIRAGIETLKAFQKAHSLGGLSVREMIEEGRQY